MEEEGEKEGTEGHSVGSAVIWPESIRVCLCMLHVWACVCVRITSSPLCVSQRLFLISADEKVSWCACVCVCEYVHVERERDSERAWALKRQRSRFREVHLAEVRSL